MTPLLTRRGFLQLSGILALSQAILPNLSAFAKATSAHRYARLLHPVTSPDGSMRFPADSVISMTESGSLEHSWLTWSDIQTMPDYQPNPPPAAPPGNLPSLMQVRVPGAALYERCDAASAVQRRLGYGSSAWAVDRLPPASPAQPGWLALADDYGDLLGWSQAQCWEPGEYGTANTIDAIRIHLRTQRLDAYQGDELLASLAISAHPGGSVPATRATARQVIMQRDARQLCWCIAASHGIHLGGADWHNNFGHSSATDDIEMHPYSARWLFHHLAREATIEIC